MEQRALRTAGQTNPNLPSDTIALNSFNILPGAAFMLIDEPDPRVWIAEKVDRNGEHERVYVWAHDGTHFNENQPAMAGHGEHRAFDLDYCYNVALVGLVLNYTDPDDNNWGTQV
jgi:hypothetical protein